MPGTGGNRRLGWSWNLSVSMAGAFPIACSSSSTGRHREGGLLEPASDPCFFATAARLTDPAAGGGNNSLGTRPTRLDQRFAVASRTPCAKDALRLKQQR